MVNPKVSVLTYYYMEGLSTYHTIESAFTYANPLVHGFVEQNYSAQINPQMYDQCNGNWAFLSKPDLPFPIFFNKARPSTNLIVAQCWVLV